MGIWQIVVRGVVGMWHISDSLWHWLLGLIQWWVVVRDVTDQHLCVALVARFGSVVSGLGSDVSLKFQLFVLVCLSFGC